MIVFEPELWEGSAHLPSGKVPTRYGAAASRAASATSATGGTPASAAAPGKSSSGLKLWDGGSFDFHDILDVINPLHHLPVVNSIYRAEAGDEIGAVPRILGSMLYGGGLVGALVGAASAIVNIVVEHETGKDLGAHIYTALFGEGAAGRRSTQVAAPKTGETKTGETKAGESKPAEIPNAASAAEAAKAATAAVAGAAAAQRAQGAHGVSGSAGAKTITPKAHAALQAFVAGLAKSASPAAAAAAAAKSAIAQSAVRIAGITSNGARANGTGANGTGANGTAANGGTSSQFRRADWYQRNQATLKAQAAALAKHQAAATAAKKATAPAKSTPTDAASAILQLFTTPGGPAAKPVAKSDGPGAGTASKTKATPAASAPPVNTAPAKPAAARRGAIAGPWVANEIASALSKYEALVKARNAAAAAK